MANKTILSLTLSLLAILSTPTRLPAQYTIDWEASTNACLSTAEFAPYFIASNTAATTTQPISLSQRGKIYRTIDTSKKFEHGYGADIILNISKPTTYTQFSPTTNTFQTHSLRPSHIWIQQLWASLKFRSLFLTIGMKENDRSIFNQTLGSGDIVQSNNARPIPQIRAGFIDFQNIPFTNGWVQIQGEIAYGKTIDSKTMQNQFNNYNSFITTGWWYHHSRCYFRTNPQQPLSITVGMQHAAQFGGHLRRYAKGSLIAEENYDVSLKDFLKIFVPGSGGDNASNADKSFHYGNHLGSWDLKISYKIHNSTTLTAYMQSPWEDGSGIGMMNGFDAVWGIEYNNPDNKIISQALIEYIDFTNQSGPIHWAPNDHPDTPITGQATGADDYYNNYMYDGWTNHSMSIGSPLIKSPIYNTDGYLRFTDNRLRGVHIGIAGKPLKNTTYRLLFSHRTSWGTPFLPAPEKRHATSFMLEATFTPPKIPKLTLKAQIALDTGSLYPKNFGTLLSITYHANITFNKNK